MTKQTSAPRPRLGKKRIAFGLLAAAAVLAVKTTSDPQLSILPSDSCVSREVTASVISQALRTIGCPELLDSTFDKNVPWDDDDRLCLTGAVAVAQHLPENDRLRQTLLQNAMHLGIWAQPGPGGYPDLTVKWQSYYSADSGEAYASPTRDRQPSTSPQLGQTGDYSHIVDSYFHLPAVARIPYLAEIHQGSYEAEIEYQPRTDDALFWEVFRRFSKSFRDETTKQYLLTFVAAHPPGYLIDLNDDTTSTGQSNKAKNENDYETQSHLATPTVGQIQIDNPIDVTNNKSEEPSFAELDPLITYLSHSPNLALFAAGIAAEFYLIHALQDERAWLDLKPIFVEFTECLDRMRRQQNLILTGDFSPECLPPIADKLESWLGDNSTKLPRDLVDDCYAFLHCAQKRNQESALCIELGKLRDHAERHLSPRFTDFIERFVSKKK